MPEKSVREMSSLERKHYSLEARTFHATLMLSVLVGAVMLLIGLGLYTLALSRQLIGEAFNLSRSAAGILEQVVDTEEVSREIVGIYRGLSEEERTQVGTDAYYARFAAAADMPERQQAVQILRDFQRSSDVDAVYLAMYDADTSALVYIADSDETETYCPPGEWESVETREMERFLSWDGTGQLYDVGNTDRYGWLCTSGVPLRGADGQVFAFVLSDVSLASVAGGMKTFALQYLIGILVVMLLAGYFMTRHMKKTLVEPINAIAQAAQDYVEDRRAGRGAADHFSVLNIRTGDEVENLNLVMADMEQGLQEVEEDLTRVTAEKERIGTELSLATRIQLAMLPGIFPAFPDRKDFDIYGVMKPAKEVGGDFYDFFLIDEDHLGLVIADVSGKGVPAALFMMASKILIQNQATLGLSPAQVLDRVNRQICSGNREEMFVTVWLGVLDLKTGTLTAANAGHEYPLLQQQEDGAFRICHDRHGFVLGGLPDMEYHEYTLQMEPGTRLFVYTDGVAEASNEAGELFGMDRLLETVNRYPDASPQELLERMEERLRAFAGDAPQFDDITMLCVQYFGSGPAEPEKEEKDVKELTIEATVGNIGTVTDFVNEELEALDCPMRIQTQIDIAIDELFGNIAMYAYDPETGPATVRVEVEEDPMAVIITFIDHGKPYDPLAAEDPDITLDAEDRPVGGLGVFLVKKTMDDVSYEYRGGQNILRIKKNI